MHPDHGRHAKTLDAAEPEERRHLALEDVHRSVSVPGVGHGFWKNWRAFSGPAILVSVGYMDPGNWSTDLTAGAQYKYGLLWIVTLSSFMAVILQICAAKLGVVTGKDLALMSRDHMPAWTRWPNWIAAEIAIASCDLAEVLGSAVALYLLFRIPVLIGVIITAADVLLLMALQGMGFRKVEAFIFVLVTTIAGCYFVELFAFGHIWREAGPIFFATFKPGFANQEALLLAIAMIGATVMPHNLYLHSAIVQTRRFQSDEASIKQAVFFNSIDSVFALSMAFLVNAAILILAAIYFFGVPDLKLPDGRPIENDWILGAYHTLTPLLGTTIASTLFAVALLASGQSSTITGTLAGQVVMEGFMHWKIRPWVRRIMTRLLAIIPAIIIVAIYGSGQTNTLLNFSQLVLGIQLPLAMIPLMYFTSRKIYMGKFANGWFMLTFGWGSAALITVLDIYAIGLSIHDLIWKP